MASMAATYTEYFPPAVRQRGDGYFFDEHVEITAVDEGYLSAEVLGSGSQLYDVEVVWDDEDQDFRVHCDCPYFRDNGHCKHLWATLREADECEYTEGEFAFSRIAGLNGNGRTAGDLARKTSRGRKKVKCRPTTPAWYEQLDFADGRQGIIDEPDGIDALAAEQTRLQYVLDLDGSFSANALVLALYQQKRLKNGGWGKPKQYSAQRRECDGLACEDRNLLMLALGNYNGTPWGGYASTSPLSLQYHQGSTHIEIVPVHHEVLLPQLCASGRCGWVVGPDQPADEATPLAWDDGPAWQFRLHVAADDKQKRWTIAGELCRQTDNGPPAVLPLRAPVLVLSTGIAWFEDRLARFDPGADFRWVQTLRRNDQLFVPYSDRGRLLAELWSGSVARRAELPMNLQVEIRQVEPRGVLIVHSAEKSATMSAGYKKRSPLYADVHFDYDGRRVPVASHDAILVAEDGEGMIERDRPREQKLLARLGELHLKPAVAEYCHEPEADLQLVVAQLPGVVDALVTDGWQVEADGALYRRAGNFSFRVASGVDWFDLESEIDFGEATATLPALLAAARQKQQYVTLDDGARGMLPEEWLEKFAPLADLAEVDGDRLRFKSSQALLLDALLSDRQGEMQVELDQQFQTFRRKLQSFDGVKPVDSPRGFHGELRKYQKDGLGWLKFLDEFGLGGCLADDMGLGKTVQVLALLQARRAYPTKNVQALPSLVVAPKSVVGNWVLEAERFAPRLEVIDYTGVERSKLVADFDGADMIVTTYHTLARDIEQLAEREFDYVVLDESQAIKNDKTQNAKACRLLKARRRLTLTGTPVENHLGELWSQFEFLNPGMLGRSTAFKQLMKSNDDGREQESLKGLRKAIAPFLLRRTKEEVLKDLPEKNEQSLFCDLLPADRKRYDQLREYYRQSLTGKIEESGLNRSKMHVLEALLRLRQAACHPGLIDKKLAKKPSAKLDLLLEQLTEVIEGGHKALVFSQFTSMLVIVRDRLDKQRVVYEYLDGKTRKRQDRVERFQNDADCSVFLISLKAGGTGLNLTAADYVFLLDPWWNPAVEAQAIDRAHRIGQERRVFAYRLIARDTVEEKIVELQTKKRELADAIIGQTDSVLKNLTAEDLNLLLS